VDGLCVSASSVFSSVGCRMHVLVLLLCFWFLPCSCAICICLHLSCFRSQAIMMLLALFWLARSLLPLGGHQHLWEAILSALWISRVPDPPRGSSTWWKILLMGLYIEMASGPTYSGLALWMNGLFIVQQLCFLNSSEPYNGREHLKKSLIVK
jgi:hypothetical protein